MEGKATKTARPVRQGPAALLALGALFVLFFLTFGVRWFVVQPFRIPAGSMRPALEVGDHVIAAKWAYGYSRFSIAPFDAFAPPGRIFGREPERGDIVIFRPQGETRDFVKRVVGMPGDRVQMIDGALYIDGAPVRREPLGRRAVEERDGLVVNVAAYRETLGNGASYVVFDRYPDFQLDNTRVFVVPERHYFMLGDDRDFSQDSRTVLAGYVPFDNLIGRVDWVIGGGR